MLLTLLALAAPLPALATSDGAMKPVSAAQEPAALEVTTSLDSCGVLESQIVCKLDVGFNQLSDAATYSASVTRADGSVIDYGSVGAGGDSLWVPYVGAGTYSVRITAYGRREVPEGKPERKVIATEVSRARAERKGERHRVEAKASPRTGSAANARGEGGGGGAANAEGGGGAQAAPACTETRPPPEPIEPEPLPEEPPEDLDPDNPDEDADGIDDEQEREDYEAALAEREAAEAVAQMPERVEC